MFEILAAAAAVAIVIAGIGLCIVGSAGALPASPSAAPAPF